MNSDNTQPQQPMFSFSGFDLSRYTPIPDQLFDELLPILSGSESKVLSYIFRRTLGFQKTVDDISLNQMLHGITTKDGRQLDQGVGLARSTLIRAINQLADKNIIIVEKNWNPCGGAAATTYRLNIGQNSVSSDNLSSHTNISEERVISNLDSPNIEMKEVISNLDSPNIEMKEVVSNLDSPNIEMKEVISKSNHVESKNQPDLATVITEIPGNKAQEAIGPQIAVVNLDYPSIKIELEGVLESNYPNPKNEQEVVSISAPQETEQQKTVRQEIESNNTRENASEQPDAPHASKDVVVALLRFNVSEAVARKLAANYDTAYIQQKIAYLEFSLARDKESIPNPAGWLRRAIEQNYAAPNGFSMDPKRQAKQREKEARRAAEIEAVRRVERKEEIEKEERNRRYEEEKRLRAEMLSQQYHVTEETMLLWQEMRKVVRTQVHIMPFIMNVGKMWLLKIEEGVATLGFECPTALEWFKNEGYPALENAFSVLVHDNLQIETTILDHQPI